MPNGLPERRTGADRRRSARHAEAPERLVRLLAQMLSLLIGALAGFFIAYVISLVFTADYQRLSRTAEQKLEHAQSAADELRPEYEKANLDYQQLLDQLYPKQRATQLGKARQTPPVPPTDGAAPPAAETESPAATDPPDLETAGIPASQLELLERLRVRRDQLKQQLDLNERTIVLMTDELANYRRSLLTLDYLSAAVVLLMTLLGYLLYPLLRSLLLRISAQWEQYSLGPEPRTAQAVIGFLAGVILSVILLLAIFNTFSGAYSILSNPAFRLLFGSFMVAILGCAGALAGVAYFSPPAREPDPFAEFRTLEAPRILDTSVIIDGRVLEVAAAGFLGGSLVVTSSVLRELQSMADSADERKRAKGRRGLELVRKMQDDPRIVVRIYDDGRYDAMARNTDEQLIHVAAAMGGMVATNDYNLNRVAAIRDVRVININALANAVKTNLLPGDFIELHIVDRGKQKGQGVGYLEDGTMVVVEDGEAYIKQTKSLKITSVTQTVQGRLIFGRVDAAEDEEANHA